MWVVGWVPWLVVALIYAIASLQLNGPIWGALGTYLRDWYFNGFMFQILEWVGVPMGAIRPMLLGIMAVAMVGIWRSKGPIEGEVTWSLLIFMMLSPTVHPWYLVWLVPWMILYRGRSTPIIFTWTMTVLLSYWVLVDYKTIGVWNPSPWIWIAEYLPVIILGVLGIATAVRNRYNHSILFMKR